MTRPDRASDVRRLAELAGRLKLVTDPTRAHLLLLLAGGEGRFDVLGSETALGRATLGRDLALLRAAGLVESRRDGLRHVYILTDAGRDLVKIIMRVAAVR